MKDIEYIQIYYVSGHSEVIVKKQDRRSANANKFLNISQESFEDLINFSESFKNGDNSSPIYELNMKDYYRHIYFNQIEEIYFMKGGGLGETETPPDHINDGPRRPGKG